MSELFDLSDRTAVVTGGAGLVGGEISAALAGHGATAVVVDTDEDAATELAEQSPGEIHVRTTDITDEAAVEELFESTVETFGSLDVLVNAAYPRTDEYGRPYEEVTPDQWRENLRLHLDSYFLTTQKASLVMEDQSDGGSIVNLGSIYGLRAPDFRVYDDLEMTSPVEYAGIKGGVVNLTRYVASYLGSSGVRANVLSPGGVFDGQDEQFVDRYESRTPLGRMADPSDVRGPAVFLASDASRYVTGQNIVVDGGWTVR